MIPGDGPVAAVPLATFQPAQAQATVRYGALPVDVRTATMPIDK